MTASIYNLLVVMVCRQSSLTSYRVGGGRGGGGANKQQQNRGPSFFSKQDYNASADWFFEERSVVMADNESRDISVFLDISTFYVNLIINMLVVNFKKERKKRRDKVAYVNRLALGTRCADKAWLLGWYRHTSFKDIIREWLCFLFVRRTRH